jgi:K(+)-stimulated pyrophosphate-energized sodium pump
VFDYLFLGYPSIWGLAPISSGLGIILSIFIYRHFKENADEFTLKGITQLIRSQNKAVYPTLLIGSVLLALISYKKILPWMSLYSFILGFMIFVPLQFFIISVGSTSTTKIIDGMDGKLSRIFIGTFRNSSAINIMSLSLATMGISICFASNQLLKYDNSTLMASIISFCLGLFIPIFMSSSIGGIFSKSIDSASDNIAENEEGISSNSISNPAVLASKASNIVYSLVTSSTDALETWLISIVTAILISINISTDHLAVVLMLSGLGLLCMMLFAMISFARTYWVLKKIWIYLRASYFFFIALSVPVSYYLINGMLKEGGTSIFISLVLGILLALVSGEVSYYYMSGTHTPLQKNILSTKLGAPFIISSGFATAMVSSWIPIIFLLIAAVVSYVRGGLFALSITALGMALTIGISSILRTYSVLSNHLSQTGEMLSLENHKREQLANLQKIGDRSSSLIRNNDIINLMIVSVPLLSSIQEGDSYIQTAKVFLMLLAGAVSVFILSGFVLKSVSKTSQKLAKELRKQFSEISGIKTGNTKPIYNVCIKIANKGAMLPSILALIFAVSAPILFGLGAGKGANMAFMIGVCSTGFAFYMIFYGSGQIWSNIKEFIEQDKMGGPGSSIHSTAVIADTVGDPLKGAVSVSIKSYIKLAMILSLLFSGVFTKYSEYVAGLLGL